LLKRRVVDAGGRKHLRRRQRAPVAAAAVGGQQAQQRVGVARATVDEAGVQPLRQFGVEPAAGPRAAGAHPQVRPLLQGRQRGAEPVAHEVLDVLARRVQQHQVGALPQRRRQLGGRDLLDEAGAQRQAQGLRGLFQRHEATRRRRAGGQHQHALGGGQRPDHGQQQQQACTQRDRHGQNW
jgi:hypothetical protein